MNILGIDPGLKTCAVLLRDGEYAEHCFPESAEEMAAFLSRYVSSLNRICIEEVEGFRNQPAPRAFTFGLQTGKWHGVLGALGLDFTTVKPTVWQQGLDLPVPADGSTWKRSTHKKHLIEAAQRLYHDAPWDTLKTIERRSALADALLVARWAGKLKGE